MSGNHYHLILGKMGRAVGKKFPVLSARQAGTGLTAIDERGLAGETPYLFGYIRHAERQKCVILKYKWNTYVI